MSERQRSGSLLGEGISLALGLVLALPTAFSRARAAEPTSDESAFRAAIEADWELQERRLGRTAGQPDSIQLALERISSLLHDQLPGPRAADLHRELARAEEFRARCTNIKSRPAAELLPLYREVRWWGRNLALSNPLLAAKPIAFMKRSRFVCQMLHEYLGYFYDYGNVSGGGLYVLEQPGRSFKLRDLLGDRLPKGNLTTLSVSLDGRTLYFAFAERAATKPDFHSPERRSFHLYALEVEGGNLRQLTRGIEDDFDPCPLPGGGLIFLSSRRGGFGRCHNPWEPLPAYTLHRWDPATGEVTTLSFHETNEWHPSLMNDGRILYTRWDYVDRSAANFHGLWISHPDGSNPVSLFGNYTMRINACYQPRAIPGSRKVIFVAGAHHADVGGSLVLVDPTRVALEASSGEDRLDDIERLTPEVCFPEAAGWPKSYFHAPWPLAENCYLVGMSFDPLPGMSSGESRDTHTGLYYFDRFGNLELLYRDPQTSSMYPIPLAPREGLPQLASAADANLGAEGEYILSDAGRSLMPLPANRRITALRVFQVLPKAGSHVANRPRLGYANAEGARMLLGTVPVEADGSAYFRAPAQKPLYFQAVDEQGRAVQGMRSVTYLQPGERRGCVGCHEPAGVAVSNRRLVALGRPASIIQAGPEGAKPMSFMRLVQPILNRRCVACHDGKTGAGKGKSDLTSAPAGTFTKSYEGLRPYVRWYEWGGASISQIATHPGHLGADESPLSGILADANHAEQTQLRDSERRSLYLWLDANAPFYGVYEEEAQFAQQQGEPVPPPALQ